MIILLFILVLNASILNDTSHNATHYGGVVISFKCIKGKIMRKRHTIKKYNGELNHIDPIELGSQLFLKGKKIDHETDPTEQFYSNGIEKDDEFLYSFTKKMWQGWHKERDAAFDKKYLKQLPDFQKSIPPIGSEVYVQFPNNDDEYPYCRIEYISEDRSEVLIRYLKNKKTLRGSNLSIVGYGYPGEFVKFYAKTPLDEPSQ